MLPLFDENPASKTPWVTFALISLCLLAFAWPELSQESTSVHSLSGPSVDAKVKFHLERAAIPCEIVERRPLTTNEVGETFIDGSNGSACSAATASPSMFPSKLVFVSLLTSMFLHAGWLHLGLNMVFLWVFGNNIEDRFGHVLFLVFYLLGGVVSTIGHIVSQPTSTVPIIGASGAIAAVMGAYYVWYPDAPIRTLLFLVIVDIRARWFLIGWFAFQFFAATGGSAAWTTHVAGFIFGAIGGRIAKKILPRLHRLTGQRVPAWDTTGGAGHGPYPHLDEIWQEPHPEAYQA